MSAARDPSSDPAAALSAHPLVRWSGLAGLVGPAVFVLVFLVFEALTPGYSPVSEPISNLEDVPNGWVQQLNFLQCGTLIALFGIGFGRHLEAALGRGAKSVQALLVVSGTGMVEASYFTPATPVEHVIGFLFFMISLLACILVVARRLLRSPLRSLGAYSLGTGLAVLALLVAFFVAGAAAPSGATPAGAGIINRVFVVLALAWVFVMGSHVASTETAGRRSLESIADP